MTTIINAVLDYWFGPLDQNGLAAPERNALWFGSSDASDHRCSELFGTLVAQATTGELETWAESDKGLVTLILLLDQFTRNIYRDTPAAFSGDARALAHAQRAIASGQHQRLPVIHQVFLFLPLEHSECLDVQQECVRLFEELATITGNPQIADYLRYAVAHRDVIAQFGRFPHRNSILGRASTAPELSYLETHGGF